MRPDLELLIWDDCKVGSMRTQSIKRVPVDDLITLYFQSFFGCTIRFLPYHLKGFKAHLLKINSSRCFSQLTITYIHRNSSLSKSPIPVTKAPIPFQIPIFKKQTNTPSAIYMKPSNGLPKIKSSMGLATKSLVTSESPTFPF